MKFCKYCGAQLEDNAVCTCEKSRAAADAQQQYVQPNPQPQQYQQPQQFGAQPPYGAPAQPSPYAVKSAAPDSPFVKALKNIPTIFVSFWKNSKAVIETAKKGNDVIVAGMYTFIFFVALLLFSMFLMIGAHGMHFGVVLLAALVLTIFIGGFYALILFAYTKKFNPGIPAAKAFTDSFITFAIESIPVSIVLLVGGLFALIGPYVGAVVISLVQIYIIVSLVTKIREISANNIKNPAVFTLVQVLAIFVALVVVALLAALFICWSYMAFVTSSVENALGSLSSWLN